MNVGWISSGSTSLREAACRRACPSRARRLSSTPSGRGEVLPRGLGGEVDAGLLEQRVPHRDPLPRRVEVDHDAVPLDPVGAEDALGDAGDELLEPGRGVVVVGVGLVPLEHRELGVVLGRDALVAEVLAELVDAVDAADDAALQVELGRDPQVEVAVEGVVVGGERPRQRAAVERLEHRGLDLDETVRRRARRRISAMVRPRVLNRSSTSGLAIRSSSRWRQPRLDVG